MIPLFRCYLGERCEDFVLAPFLRIAKLNVGAVQRIESESAAALLCVFAALPLCGKVFKAAGA